MRRFSFLRIGRSFFFILSFGFSFSPGSGFISFNLGCGGRFLRRLLLLLLLSIFQRQQSFLVQHTHGKRAARVLLHRSECQKISALLGRPMHKQGTVFAGVTVPFFSLFIQHFHPQFHAFGGQDQILRLRHGQAHDAGAVFLDLTIDGIAHVQGGVHRYGRRWFLGRRHVGLDLLVSLGAGILLRRLGRRWVRSGLHRFRINRRNGIRGQSTLRCRIGGRFGHGHGALRDHSLRLRRAFRDNIRRQNAGQHHRNT